MNELTQHSFLDMIIGSGPVVKAVLYVLVVLSIASWAVTFAKFWQFRRARDESKKFGDMFWEARNFTRVEDSAERLAASPLAKLFTRGYKELVILLKGSGQDAQRSPAQVLDIVERALRRAELDETRRLEGGLLGLTFLATTASAAPFIGLFGTVWGIMNAFHGLGVAKMSTIQAVAPGISEALIATAIGLGAAIPAAIAYNYFVVDVRRFRESMDSFVGEFLSLSRTYVER